MPTVKVPLEWGFLEAVLVENIVNLDEVWSLVCSGSLECGLVRPSLIVDIFQLAIAANKAKLSHRRNKLVTKNLFTETLYNLSPTKNITMSLTKFGASKENTNALVFVFDENPRLQDVLQKIKGEEVHISNLSHFTDIEEIKICYSISENELKVSSLLDSVLTRIATKGFI